MFTDQLLEGQLLVAAGVGICIYWLALGAGFDSRLFLSLNFSIITLWVFSSTGSFPLRAASLLFIILFVFSNRAWRPRNLPRRLDRLLHADLSFILFFISCAAVLINIQSGATTLSAKEILLEQKADDTLSRYAGYLLMTGGWLSVHVTCTAALQPRWSALQKLALVATVIAAVTSLSKASFLPILLTLLFVYARRIGKVRLLLIMSAGLALTLLMIQRLFEDLPLDVVAEIFFSRIIKNVDVLDYIEGLGPQTSVTYPHKSPFYLFWPFFQFTQENFVVPGVWLHGTLFDDWRGFGPNPTFVGDLLIGAEYFGLILAPMFGVLLRVADDCRYRVFIAMICYQFLQDWYIGCLDMALFALILTAAHLLKRRHRLKKRCLSHNANHRRNNHPALPSQTAAPSSN